MNENVKETKIGGGGGGQQKKTSKAAKEKETADPILRRDNEEYRVVRKLPPRFPTDANHIYITNKTDFKAQTQKCQYLIRNFKQRDHIVLHAMGPAINRAINLALKLKKELPYLELHCHTSSIALVDDLVPLVDTLEISTQQRFISSVHIKITNSSTVLVGTNLVTTK